MSNFKLWTITLFIIAITVLVVKCLPVSGLFVLAAGVAYVLNPLVNYLCKRFKMKRWLAVFIVITATLAIIAALLAWIIPILITQAVDFVSSLSNTTKIFNGYIDNLKEYMRDKNMSEEFINYTDNFLEVFYKFLSWLASSLANFVISAFYRVLDFIIIVVLVCYMLMDGERILNGFIDRTNPKYKNRVVKIFRDMNELFKSYIKGQVLIAFIFGAIMTIILYIMNIPFAILIGIMTFLLNFIPYLGSTAATFLAAGVALFTRDPMTGLWVLVVTNIAGQLKGYLIVPRVQSKACNLHPVVVLFAVMAASHALGLVGMFIAVPIAGLVRIFYRNAVEIIKELK